jgi:tRNA A37 threonylcarbamoyladenosine modification protein TsaB
MAAFMNNAALLIDSATRHLLVARISGTGTVLHQTETASAGENALDLAVAALFPELAEIEEIYLGEGPGSFVGLRSAFAYARMLSMLREIPCRTFHSSRLWHLLLGVPMDEWLLMRTNAKLYYAERFVPAREAAAVDIAEADKLTGNIHCYSGSWLSKNMQAENNEIPAHWQITDFGPEKIPGFQVDSALLRLSEVKPHDSLTPIYGHELHFQLAKGFNGQTN